MNLRDPKLIALQFNECINNQDLAGLTDLMSEDHSFIDREGKVHKSKEFMVKSWKDFFHLFPHYKNTFTRVDSQNTLVAIVGYAFWSDDRPYDPVLWTAKIESDFVAEWCVYEDTPGNRKLLNII